MWVSVTLFISRNKNVGFSYFVYFTLRYIIRGWGVGRIIPLLVPLLLDLLITKLQNKFGFTYNKINKINLDLHITKFTK